MKIKKLLNKKITKLTKKLTKWYREHFSGEKQLIKTIRNYTLQISLHPWYVPFVHRDSEFEANLGFISVRFSNKWGAHEEPVFNKVVLFHTARKFSKELGIPNAFTLSVGTNPMSFAWFSYDFNRVQHYLPMAMSQMMTSYVNDSTTETKRKPIKKSKKGKK